MSDPAEVDADIDRQGQQRADGQAFRRSVLDRQRIVGESRVNEPEQAGADIARVCIRSQCRRRREARACVARDGNVDDPDLRIVVARDEVERPVLRIVDAEQTDRQRDVELGGVGCAASIGGNVGQR